MAKGSDPLILLGDMNRRTLIAALAGLPFAGWAVAGKPPFRLKLIGGAPDGDGYLAGVAVDLDQGWKTYWRIPGESGIPPMFDFSKSLNVKSAEILYPTPMRYQDQSGETIGYSHRVVFPLRVKPTDPAVPVKLDLALFLGVCKDVCIPVNGRIELELAFRSPDPGEQRDVDMWLARVPMARTDLVGAARIENATLILDLAQPADDIFVESATSAYFRAPRFSAGGLEANLAIDGAVNPSQLKGSPLTLTLRRGESGFVQTVTAQ